MSSPINEQNTDKRYQSLIISIGLFLTLIGALLAFTFYTSSILQKNTRTIALSNQIANDAQAVIKDLFDMQNSYGEEITSPHVTTVLKRLKDNSARIETSLTTLEKGGVVADKSGKQYTLPTIEDTQILKNVQQTRQEWNQLKPKVDDYLGVAGDIEKDSLTSLSMAGEQAKTSSLAMNDSLDKLTTSVFNNAESQANIIRLIQAVGIAIILGYFAIFIFFFVRRLRDADALALAAQKETQDIMSNVNTGLFLLDNDLNIGQQYSAHLENIIGEKDIGGKNLSTLLQNKVSAKDLETTQGFVKQLYNPRVKEKLIDDLNPLKKIMLSNQKNQNRFLDFKFSRVYHQKAIDKILVNVQDITNQVRLEQRLEQERAQNDLQIEMLTTILNVSPKIITEFITNTRQNINDINEVLKTPGSSQSELQEKLNRMYRVMHSLKGEASSLSLHSFTVIATNFEEKLKGLQHKSDLVGNDFLPLTIHLEELLNLSNTIDALGRRINHSSADTNAVKNGTGTEATHTSPATKGMNEFYQQYADNIATRQGKQVALKATGFNDLHLSRDIESSLKKIVIQLIRNAVVHGIETPDARVAAGKSNLGNINLSLLDLAESYKLTIEDDGAGINFPAIKEKAIQMGYSPDEVNGWSEQKLITLLFKSGFSTKDTTDEDAGRGVGLDIIKEDIQLLQGQLNVDTKRGQFTRFTIRLPKNPTAE